MWYLWAGSETKGPLLEFFDDRGSVDGTRDVSGRSAEFEKSSPV